MKEYNIIYLNGEQGKIKVKTAEWEKLHKKFKGYFSKEYSEFFKKFNLEPTHFNLNSLNMFKGVILTEQEFIQMKGGLK